MSLRDLVTNLLRPQQAKAVKSSATGPMIAWSNLGQPRWTQRRYDTLAEAGFRKNVIAYRCVMQVSSAASAIPWLLYDNGEELDRHPLLDLLRHPNPLQDGMAFFESVYAYLQIAGNAFIEAVKPNEGDQPVELYVLRPDRMKVIPGPAGLPQAYQYSVNGQTTTWPADPLTGCSNILHLRSFHPLDDWYGMAPLEAAQVSVDQHNAAGSWNQALLNQGARPSGALVYAPRDGAATLTDDQVHRLREELGTIYQGSNNAGRPLILEGGLDWREMSLSPKDMDWLAGRNMAARDIALAFGVPAQLVGVPDAQTYANLAEARMALYEETVMPLVNRVIGGFDHWLAPMYDGTLELDFDPDEVSALALRRDTQWNKLQSTDFLTINEKRHAVGYGPIEGGDVLDGSRRPVVAPSAPANPFAPPKFNARSPLNKPIWNNAEKDIEDEFGEDDEDYGDNEPADNESKPSDTWANPNTLQTHHEDHGADFDAQSPEEYVDFANQFYQRLHDDQLPSIEGNDGTIRMYEPASNTFGAYNSEGNTLTFFKPDDGLDYFQAQIDRDLASGSHIIYPLSEIDEGGGGSNQGGDGGGGGGGPITDIFHPGTQPWETPEE